LIALAMSVVMLLDTLSQFGFEVPLIQKKDATRDDFDTAWTLNILVSALVALAIALCAPLAARFYSEPRVEAVLYWIAVGHFFFAFQNIGTVLFRKQLNFRRDFALQITQKLAMLAVGIPLAFALRSYWALVAGIVAGRVAAVIISYAFLPYRPRLCLASWRELLGFSKWLQVNGMLGYFRDRGFIYVLGRALDAPAVGLFTLADEIASLPSTTLVAPLNRAVFPGFAQLSGDAARLRDGYKTMLGLVTLVALPAAVGLASVAALVVPVALGPQWQGAVPLLTLLALAGATRTLTASTISVQYALGRPHLQTYTTGLQALTLLPMVTAGVKILGLEGAAWAYLLHALLVFMPVSFWFLLRRTPVRLSDVLQPLWRPTLAAAAMFAVVKPLADAWAAPESLVALPRLLVLVALGALIYVGVVALLWALCGRPAGAELAVTSRAGPMVRRVLGRPYL
jgi:O-antigen/teichoic acid export membrane protein